MRHLDAISFIGYFIKLRLGVALGLYYTAEPLGLAWRWRKWRYIQRVRRGRRL